MLTPLIPSPSSSRFRTAALAACAKPAPTPAAASPTDAAVPLPLAVPLLLSLVPEGRRLVVSIASIVSSSFVHIGPQLARLPQRRTCGEQDSLVRTDKP